MVKMKLCMYVTKKDNGTLHQREHCTSKYSLKYTIHKTLITTVKSPVKVSMDSRRLTHLSGGILNGRFKYSKYRLGNTEIAHYR